MGVRGGDVLVGKKNVDVGEGVMDGVEEDVAPVIGMEIPVKVGSAAEVELETLSENATTVSAMTVLILATKKSTTPMGGVPAWAAVLISRMPNNVAPHKSPKPRTAARTTQSREM